MSREVNQELKEYKLDLIIELKEAIIKSGKTRHWFNENQPVVNPSLVNKMLYCNYPNTFHSIGVEKLERLIEYANSLKGTEEER